jgi:hypothetical protein
MLLRASLFLFSVFVAGFAISQAPAKARYQKLYDKISKAFEDKKEADFLSYLSPQFQQVQNGKPPVTRAQIASTFEKEMSTLKNVHWSREVLKVTPNGPVFDVYVSSHLVATIIEKDKAHAYVIDSKSLDTWNAAMKIDQSRVLKLSMIKDGKHVTVH